MVLLGFPFRQLATNNTFNKGLYFLKQRVSITAFALASVIEGANGKGFKSGHVMVFHDKFYTTPSKLKAGGFVTKNNN